MREFLLILGFVCLFTIVGCEHKTDTEETNSSAHITEDQSTDKEETEIDSSNDNLSGTNETSSFELVKPTDEIKNSKINDGIVQVGNIVLPNNLSLTVEQVVSELGKDGYVYASIPYGADSSVIPALKKEENIVIYRPQDANQEKLKGTRDESAICSLDVINTSEEPQELDKCLVLDIHAPSTLPYSLNFFYAGNINGIIHMCFGEEEKEKYKNFYEERKNEYNYETKSTDELVDFAREKAQEAGLDFRGSVAETGGRVYMNYELPEIVPNYDKRYNNEADYHRYFTVGLLFVPDSDNPDNLTWFFQRGGEIDSQYEIDLTEKREKEKNGDMK